MVVPVPCGLNPSTDLVFKFLGCCNEESDLFEHTIVVNDYDKSECGTCSCCDSFQEPVVKKCTVDPTEIISSTAASHGTNVSVLPFVSSLDRYNSLSKWSSLPEISPKAYHVKILDGHDLELTFKLSKIESKPLDVLLLLDVNDAIDNDLEGNYRLYDHYTRIGVASYYSKGYVKISDLRDKPSEVLERIASAKNQIPSFTYTAQILIDNLYEVLTNRNYNWDPHAIKTVVMFVNNVNGSLNNEKLKQIHRILMEQSILLILVPVGDSDIHIEMKKVLTTAVVGTSVANVKDIIINTISSDTPYVDISSEGVTATLTSVDDVVSVLIDTNNGTLVDEQTEILISFLGTGSAQVFVYHTSQISVPFDTDISCFTSETLPLPILGSSALANELGVSVYVDKHDTLIKVNGGPMDDNTMYSVDDSFELNCSSELDDMTVTYHVVDDCLSKESTITITRNQVVQSTPSLSYDNFDLTVFSDDAEDPELLDPRLVSKTIDLSGGILEGNVTELIVTTTRTTPAGMFYNGEPVYGGSVIPVDDALVSFLARPHRYGKSIWYVVAVSSDGYHSSPAKLVVNVKRHREHKVWIFPRPSITTKTNRGTPNEVPKLPTQSMFFYSIDSGDKQIEVTNSATHFWSRQNYMANYTTPTPENTRYPYCSTAEPGAICDIELVNNGLANFSLAIEQPLDPLPFYFKETATYTITHKDDDAYISYLYNISGHEVYGHFNYTPRLSFTKLQDFSLEQEPEAVNLTYVFGYNQVYVESQSEFVAGQPTLFYVKCYSGMVDPFCDISFEYISTLFGVVHIYNPNTGEYEEMSDSGTRSYGTIHGLAKYFKLKYTPSLEYVGPMKLYFRLIDYDLDFMPIHIRFNVTSPITDQLRVSSGLPNFKIYEHIETRPSKFVIHPSGETFDRVSAKLQAEITTQPQFGSIVVKGIETGLEIENTTFSDPMNYIIEFTPYTYGQIADESICYTLTHLEKDLRESVCYNFTVYPLPDRPGTYDVDVVQEHQNILSSVQNLPSPLYVYVPKTTIGLVSLSDGTPASENTTVSDGILYYSKRNGYVSPNALDTFYIYPSNGHYLHRLNVYVLPTVKYIGNKVIKVYSGLNDLSLPVQSDTKPLESIVLEIKSVQSGTLYLSGSPYNLGTKFGYNSVISYRPQGNLPSEILLSVDGNNVEIVLEVLGASNNEDTVEDDSGSNSQRIVSTVIIISLSISMFLY